MRFYEYINEKRQDAPELKKIYDRINKKLFDNKLPNDLPIK